MSKIFKSDLLKSIGSGYLLFLLTNLIALFLTPFILRYVNKDEYGFYILCVELFAWLGFVNLGTAKVLGPSVARELAHENETEIVYFFNSSFWFQLAVSLLTIPLYYAIVIFSGAEKSNIPGYETLILLFAFAVFIQNMSGQFSEMIIATRKIHLDNRIQILTLLLRLVFILILVPIIGIKAVFYIYFAISLIDFSRKYRRVRTLYPTLNIQWRFFSKSHFKDLLSNGVFFTLASLTTILVTKFDQFFLGREISLALVANYYVSIKLVLIAEKLIGVFFNNFRPHISRMYGQKEHKKLEQLYLELSALVLGLSVFFVLILTLVNKTFVSYWVGEEMFIGDEFNKFIVLFYALNVITLPSRIILVSTLSFIRHLTIAGFFQGVLRISILFVGFSTMGIKVLPISNIAALFLFGFAYQLLLTIRFFNGTKKVKISSGAIFISLSVALILSFIKINFLFAMIALIIGTLFLFSKINLKNITTKTLFLQ